MSQADTSQKPAFDPFEMWRQLYEANEQAWTKTIKELTTTKDYAEAQGKLLESMLAFQKMMRDSVTAQLSSVNIPTRDDVSRLGELILSLEEKVDRLDDRMPVLEQRLSALENKVERLAAVETAIEAVGQRIDRLSDRLAERDARQVEKAAEASGGGPSRPTRPSGSRGRAAEK